MNQQITANPEPAPLELECTIRGRYGSYKILGTIKDTLQSRVYRGISQTEGMKMIVKEYLQNHSSNAFEREGCVHNLLYYQGVHGNIIPAREFVMTEDDRPMGIFPYVAGRTLDEVIDPKQNLTPQQVAPLVSALCDTLELIHNLGIVHRDVKPSNIMISESAPGTVVPLLFDFGTAWHRNINCLDKEGSYYGTPNYMAPETWNFSFPDRKQDIYSMATVIYQLLAKTVPFQVDDLLELFMIYKNQVPVPDLTKRNSTVSAGVKSIIEKALAKDPEERYQSAAELKRDYLEAVR